MRSLFLCACENGARAIVPFLVFATILTLGAHQAWCGFITLADDFGSKWDDPVHGTTATITWGFMPDGTTVDGGVFIAAEVNGGSDITQMRSDFDAQFGTGALNAAIRRAFRTWQSVANVRFVGPIPDTSGLPVGAAGSTAPDIRIGAFDPVPNSGFAFVGGVGFGPPGDDLNFPDALAGDVLFNLEAGFLIRPGGENAPYDPFNPPGNDLEGLALHELGHAAMGLGHPDEGRGDVMFVGANCCDFINRWPSRDDIAGAHVVYGVPEPGMALVLLAGVALVGRRPMTSGTSRR